MTNVKKRTKPAECLKFGGSGHRLVVEVLGFERLECRQLCDTQFLKTGAQPVRVRASQVRLPDVGYRLDHAHADQHARRQPIIVYPRS
jgi:hypothetical protein